MWEVFGVAIRMTYSIRATPEFRRIQDLPRRDPAIGEDFVNEMTKALCAPKGGMKLRPRQALALHDIATQKGGFIPLDVGEGKTLVMLLAPYVLDAERPLILVPANLVKKTWRDVEFYKQHWMVPDNLKIVSYEALGTVDHANDLEEAAPDVLVFEEAHKLKSPRSARTRRVARYMVKHPETRCVALSGTIISRSIKDFEHIAEWCLREMTPLPRSWNELEEWAAVIDEKSEWDLIEFAPGALLTLCNEEELKETDEITAARRGFQRRMIETPGIVSTPPGEGEHIGASIILSAIEYRTEEKTEEAFKTLRCLGFSPADNYPLVSSAEIWMHARALALGLVYVWNPRPPREWMAARRAWHTFARAAIRNSRTWDSVEHVARAVTERRMLDDGALEKWQAIEPTFTPNIEPVWFDSSAIQVCKDWMKTPGVVWTEHTFFAERLALETGSSYFGAEGLDANGNFIDDAPGNKAIIASIDANREGRNLQERWHRNLITSIPPGASILQQVIGRTHRPGQKADEVIVDVLRGCNEHDEALSKALARARMIQDTTGATQKLLLADFNWSFRRINSYRWGAKYESHHGHFQG